MGRIHVRAWQTAYRGVMPDAYLDGLVVEERTAMWRDRLARPGLPPLLVAALDDAVAGFAAVGAAPSSSGDRGEGEPYAINLDPMHRDWGSGECYCRR